MTRTQKVWDFVFAVALIGGAPLAVFIVLGFGLHQILPSDDEIVLRLRTILPVLAALASFLFTCWWRTKHRLLQRSLMPLEVGAGVFFGFAAFIIILLAGYAAFHAD